MISVREQLEIVKGLMGYRYGDSQVDLMVTDYIASVFSAWGLKDIRDLGVRAVSEAGSCYPFNDDTGVQSAVPVSRSGYQFVNVKTGSPVSIAFWNDFFSNETQCYLTGRGFPIQRGTSYRFCYDVDGESESDQSAGRIGDNSLFVWVLFTENGIPYFTAQLFNRRGMGLWAAIKELATIVLAAVTFVVPGVNAAIAGSIFGSLATAYPALTAAASQVMLNTALSGGDVEAAVKSVAYSYLGQSAGGLVEGVTDSDALGKLAAAATSAAAQGGDVERAVALTALRLAPEALTDVVDYYSDDSTAVAITPVVDSNDIPIGDTNVSIFDIPAAAPTIDWDVEYQANVSAPSIDEIASWAPAVVEIGVPFDGGNVPLAAPAFEPIGYSLDDLFAAATGETPHATPVAVDGSGGALSTAIASAPANQPVDTPASSFFDDITWDDTVDKLSALAVAAIKVHQAYQAANRPPVQPAIQTTRTGSTQTARSDGVLSTTDPATGRVVVTRPPAGVPYALPDGGAVVNNGNGTYTVISPTGAAVTRSYSSDIPVSGVARVQPATWIDGVPNWATMLIAAGAIAVVAKR